MTQADEQITIRRVHSTKLFRTAADDQRWDALQGRIDAAYDCDEPEIAEALEAEQLALPSEIRPISWIECANRAGEVVAILNDDSTEIFFAPADPFDPCPRHDYRAMFQRLGLDVYHLRGIADMECTR